MEKGKTHKTRQLCHEFISLLQIVSGKKWDIAVVIA